MKQLPATDARSLVPLAVDLTGRRVLVVGGGPVATRRAHDLAHAGARVEVVTPWASDEMWSMADAHEVRLTLREYAPGDESGAWLVHTATGSAAVDDAVADACEASRVWCVRADDASRSTAWTPAVVRHDGLTVAVSAGGDPRRAAEVRDRLAEALKSGDVVSRRRRRGPKAPGWVALVGGGPGDPDLITRRGWTLLRQADVVVVDRLAPRDLIDGLDPDVEVIDASKGPDAHVLTQTQINEVIVARALKGQRVVRLKGGDPFVLGRGGEEVQACAAAGVAVEVVPGITSAIAVPGAAGIPVTHRGAASRFTVVSAHDESVVDHAAQAPVDGTLVVLMGVGRLQRLMTALVDAGRDPQTPAAIVENGTLPGQRAVHGTVGTLARLAEDAGVGSPAVIVVGDAAAVGRDLGAAMSRIATAGGDSR